jgi:hypothetical protein
MLPHRDHDDEAALDVMAGADDYWMRFFASLRMTARDQDAPQKSPDLERGGVGVRQARQK